MKKKHKVESFTNDVPLEKAMKIIIQFAQNSGYKVDEFDKDKGDIILSDSANGFSWGCIYTISLKEQLDSSILIAVGTENKEIQLFGVDMPHEKLIKGIQTALFANYDSNKTNISQMRSLKPKFCTNCGKGINQNDEIRFCDNCGVKL